MVQIIGKMYLKKGLFGAAKLTTSPCGNHGNKG